MTTIDPTPAGGLDRADPRVEAASARTFWRSYLAEHRSAGNRWLHVAGTVLSWICVGAAIVTRQWWWLLVAPVLGYGCAWTGHLGIEHNRPLTSRRPVRAWACDQWMTFLMLAGRLPWRSDSPVAEPPREMT